MKRAFHSVIPPKNFNLQIVEHNVEGVFFLELIANEKEFVKLLDEDKRSAVEYMIRVKNALEDNGALVQLTRKALE